MTGLRIAIDGRALVGGPARGIAQYLAALLRAWPAGDELRVVLPRGAATPVRVPFDAVVDARSGRGPGGGVDDARSGGGPGGGVDDARSGGGPGGGVDDARSERDPGGGLVGGGASGDHGPAAARDGSLVGVRSPWPSRVLFTVAAATGRPRLDRLADGCDVAWVPAPAPVAVGSVPYVLTVHDRSWEARPADFTRYERLWHAAARPRRLARDAARVITTTRWGADDLAGAWSLDPSRVRAVHLAPVMAPDRPASLGDHGGPVLFVGALEPRKGPDVLARAIELARPNGFDDEVVVVGGGRLDGLLHAPGVRAAGPLGDVALSALYASARALVVPSRLEGFGLPGLEALAHGTPVISSDLPPVREVLGDAATYVPEGDPAALAATLLDLPPSPPPPGPLAGRTWTAVAAETRAVLAEAAG